MTDPGIFNPPKVIARKFAKLLLAYAIFALIVGLIGWAFVGPVGNHGRAVRERQRQERQDRRRDEFLAPDRPSANDAK